MIFDEIGRLFLAAIRVRQNGRLFLSLKAASKAGRYYLKFRSARKDGRLKLSAWKDKNEGVFSMKRWKKPLRTLLVVILCVILGAVGLGLGIFRKELSSLRSIEKVSDTPFYTMDYSADYGLDELLETGASTDGELAAFIIKKLMKGIPVSIQLPDFGCATFNAKTEDGDAIFGRNFDNPDAPMMLVRTHPENGYASISMVNLSYVGYGGDYLPEGIKNQILALAAPYIPLDGINEKGLSVGVLQLSQDPTEQDTGKVDITTTAAIRMMLDKCATVEEAVEMLDQFDMHASANACFHFQIADAEGNSVVVEYIENEMNLIYSDTSSLYCTNFVLSEGEHYNEGVGQERYAILQETLENCGGVLADETAAMELLSAARSELITLDNGSEMSTQWSAVYNNTDAALTLCLQTDYDTVYTFSVTE